MCNVTEGLILFSMGFFMYVRITGRGINYKGRGGGLIF